MSKKSKEYYLLDHTTQSLYVNLDYQELRNFVEMNYFNGLKPFSIYEYGIEEDRGIFFKLDPRFRVDHKFAFDFTKMEFVLL